MQGAGWTKVISKRSRFRWDVFPFGGRNRKSDSSAVTSFFVSEFPEYYNAKSLFELFGCSGNVVEVAISPRMNKFGKRFGFARFIDVEDGRLLAIRLDNILIEGRKIHVNLPRFRRNREGVLGRKGVAFSKGLEKRKLASGSSRVLPYSYSDVVGNKGQDFVATKVNNVLFNFQSEQSIRNRFEKAFMGRVCIPGSAYNIQNYLEMEGIFAIRVTPLGGNCCLLEENEEGFIGDLIKEGETWWKSWFSVIEKWEAGSVDGCRDAWFRIYGIPIRVWSNEFFVSLGDKWGRFICLVENTSKGEAFDVARMLVNIPISLKIPDCVSVCIDGELHNLCIREDAQNFYRSIEGNQKVLSSDGESSESEFDRIVLDSDSDCSIDSVGSEARQDLHSDSLVQKVAVSSDNPRNRHSGVSAEVGSRIRTAGLSGVVPDGITSLFDSSDDVVGSEAGNDRLPKILVHKSVGSPTISRYRHSEVVANTGPRIRAVGSSGVVTEGNNNLIVCSGGRADSDDVLVGSVIICKDDVVSDASVEHHLEPRGRKDNLLKRLKDSECGPSASCTLSCSEGSSEFVSCSMPKGLLGLGPEDGSDPLPRDSGMFICNDGKSGLVPDAGISRFRLPATHSGEVRISGEILVCCKVHSGISGDFLGSEDASVGVKVNLEQRQFCNNNKVLRVSHSDEGIVEAEHD